MTLDAEGTWMTLTGRQVLVASRSQQSGFRELWLFSQLRYTKYERLSLW